MNERYSSDNAHTGVSKKSAASAKPKSKAAASVTVKGKAKSPQEKKAAAKAQRKQMQAEQRELDRKYYKPDTPRYRKLRTIWWAAIGVAIACTAVAFVGRGTLPDAVNVATLVVAYGLIIFAFYLEFSKIRKERRAYQDRMIKLEAEQKKAEKAAARAERSKNQQHQPKGSGKNASRNPKTQAKAAAAKAADKADAEKPAAEATE